MTGCGKYQAARLRGTKKQYESFDQWALRSLVGSACKATQIKERNYWNARIPLTIRKNSDFVKCVVLFCVPGQFWKEPERSVF
jgi:hypothetical protein